MNNEVKEHPHTYRAAITGFGSFAPAKKLTNEDLAKTVNTSDEWITTRTGIKVRHITTDSETTAFLATEAAKRALAQANLDAGPGRNPFIRGVHHFSELIIRQRFFRRK